MARTIILDWINTRVLLSSNEHRDVKFQVYRDSDKHFLEMRAANDEPIHTLELPEGMKLDRTSYEVLLRYVLLDVVAA